MAKEDYKLYSLLSRKDTEEEHLFLRKKGAEQKCVGPKLSICEKMNTAERKASIFVCANEVDARATCANRGRSVCGTCVSNLYASYP